MKRIFLPNNIIHVNIKENDLSKDICFFSEEDLAGKLFYMKNDDSLAGLQISNETWIIERKNDKLDNAHITVNNIRKNSSSLVTDLEARSSNAISVYKNGLNVIFCKTCYWKNSWAWVDIITNENIIDFEIKQGIGKRGKSVIAPQYLKFPEISILCALGWYILQLQDDSIKEKISYLKEFALDDTTFMNLQSAGYMM